MELIQETREPQRLYAPSRSSLRPAGAPAVPGDRKEPWTTDGWNPAGQEQDYATSQRGPLLGRALAAGAVGLANLALFAHSRLLENLVVVIDLFGAVVLFDLLWRLWQATRRPRLRWTTLPAFPGGTLEGVLIARPVLEPIAAVRTVLRCVRDRRSTAGGEAALEPTILYQQIAEIPIPPEQEKLRRLDLSFHLPPDLPGTDLAAEEATYWQVALRIPVVGPDVEIVFLAPVYAKS